MIAFASAKINLGLHVLSRREDGFHNIESLFYPISWNDVVEILPSKGKTEIVMHQSAEIIETEQNLVYKAWKLLNKLYSIDPVRFHILKAIPSGAGLGGGSSDATTALKMLNRFFNLMQTNEQLRNYALQLGSDCPFFINAHPAIASGRGEILSPLKIDLSNYTIVVAKPRAMSDGRQGISTAEAYSAIVPNNSRLSIAEIVSQPIENWKNNLKNDFQAAMELRFTEISNLIQKFYDSGALYAAMSGSGAACFGIFDKKNPDIHLSSRDFQIFSSVL
jgi:4-diphosphocytidyl-2-C-methyl-D-erythritol kinase